MHSLLTPILANEVISEHARAARAHRAGRGGRRVVLRRLALRGDAAGPLVPRGRTLPPFAH